MQEEKIMNINEILFMLDWNNSQEIKQKGRICAWI